MGIKPTFAAEVRDDLTLRFINPAKIKQHLLPLKGQLVMVTAEKLRKHRTDAQARYYRGVVLKTIAERRDAPAVPAETRPVEHPSLDDRPEYAGDD